MFAANEFPLLSEILALPLAAASNGVLQLLTVLVLAFVAVIVLRSYQRVRGSTLVGPWAWTLAALLGLGVVALLPAEEAYDAGRFAAVMGIFCPVMSVLGAKRPQDKAWHWIVLSLWGILALPALEAMVLRPGQTLAIIDFRAWFLLVLIGLNVLVYLPTRHWLAALLLGGAQTCLCWPYLPWTSASYSPWQTLNASLLLWGAALLTMWPKRRASGFNRTWLDFRDAFGALWAARVLERVNAAATMYDWPVRLGWYGFHDANDPAKAAEIPPELEHSVSQTLTNLLRRFVVL